MKSFNLLLALACLVATTVGWGWNNGAPKFVKESAFDKTIESATSKLGGLREIHDWNRNDIRKKEIKFGSPCKYYETYKTTGGARKQSVVGACKSKVVYFGESWVDVTISGNDNLKSFPTVAEIVGDSEKPKFIAKRSADEYIGFWEYGDQLTGVLATCYEISMGDKRVRPAFKDCKVRRTFMTYKDDNNRITPDLAKHDLSFE